MAASTRGFLPRDVACRFLLVNIHPLVGPWTRLTRVGVCACVVHILQMYLFVFVFFKEESKTSKTVKYLLLESCESCLKLAKHFKDYCSGLTFINFPLISVQIYMNS